MVERIPPRHFDGFTCIVCLLLWPWRALAAFNRRARWRERCIHRAALKRQAELN